VVRCVCGCWCSPSFRCAPPRFSSRRRGPGVVLFCGVSFMASSSSSFGLLLAAAAVPVVPSAPVSLAPLSRVSWGDVVSLARLGWDAPSSSVLVWSVGSSVPVVCRVGSLPPAAVSALVSELRSLVRSGAPCRLGVRGSWAGGRWFCAVSPA